MHITYRSNQYYTYIFSKTDTHVHSATTINTFKLFPNDKFLDSSKLKEFTDDNFEFYEDGRKFLKWIENTLRKGEIASNFSFFHSVFYILVLQTRKHHSLFEKGLKSRDSLRQGVVQ